MFPNVEYIKTLVNGLKEFVNSKIKSLPQSNLDQNDPTAKDYVKNRTHWVENRYRQKDYLISLNSDGVSSVENKQYKNGVIPLVVGEQVQVSFVTLVDGSISSQCTAIVAKDDSGEPCIDQPIGLPITIYADRATYRRDWVNNSGSGHIIVTRTVALKHVHPMDEEYLVNGQEKICWTESGLTELYTNKNAEFKLSGVYFYIVASPSIDSFGLVAGKKYRVVWDEVPYDCTCVSASRYGRNFSWIGSPTLAAPYNEFGSGNSFPFCISTKRDGTKIEGNNVAASRPGKHSFILYEIGDDIVHKIPDKYIPNSFFEIKASINGDPNEEGFFNATADKSAEDIFGALERGELPYINFSRSAQFEDRVPLWLADYGRDPMFVSLIPRSSTKVEIMSVLIDGENSYGISCNLSTPYILMAEQRNFGYWYIDGEPIEKWYTKIKENPSSYPILCLYKGTYDIKYEYEGPLFLYSITDTEIIYKRTLEDGNWVGFKLSAVDGSPSKNGFIKGVSKEFILASSTADSTKKFKITVDDTGALSAAEVTT